jgi:hypothetical protein
VLDLVEVQFVCLEMWISFASDTKERWAAALHISSEFPQKADRGIDPILRTGEKLPEGSAAMPKSF